MKYVFDEENSETEYIDEDNQEQTNNKTLYNATIVPAVIISVLGIFLILMALIFSFD